MTSEEAIKKLENFAKHIEPNEEFLTAIKALSAENTAEWIIHKDTIGVTKEILYIFECSGCGKCITEQSRYCPNCGAKMKESEEE